MGRPNLNIFPWSDSEDDGATDSSQSFQHDAKSSDDMDQGPGKHEGEDENMSGLSMSLLPETCTASKILWHCVKLINDVRRHCGGTQLCVFKIGLTSNPLQRMEGYLQQNFKVFAVIHKVTTADLLGMLEMLEAALIAEFHDGQRCCRNKQLGGESMRDNSFKPRFPPPYFAYVAAACAAQKEPILA